MQIVTPNLMLLPFLFLKVYNRFHSRIHYHLQPGLQTYKNSGPTRSEFE